MIKTKTIIEFNGRRYDAVSGRPLTRPLAAPKTIDGIVRSRRSAPVVLPRPAKPVNQAKTTAKPHRPRAVAQPTSHQKPAPQAAKTLMRQAVHKPAASFKGQVRAQNRTDVLVRPPSTTVQPKASIHQVDAKRLARAAGTPHSSLISRFGSVGTPAHITTAPAKVQVRPAAAPVAAPVVLPAPASRPSADIFEQALQRATSHEQPPVKPAKRQRRGRRLTNIGATVAAVLLVGGFIAYQNMANLTLKVAAARAGFAASLPGYQPAGFSIGQFAYHPGNVTIHFRSNSDGRSFALVEQPSGWDSASLLSNFVNSAAGKSYQTALAAGQTIYLYGNHNDATWVSGGIWYRINNQNGLSTAQIVNLASSM